MAYSKIPELASLDWGCVTPELSRGDEFIHIFNHHISSRRGIENTVSFIKGRIIWYNVYLKKELTHTVVIDDAGQSVGDDVRDYIRNALSGYAETVRFMSEDEGYGI